MCTSTHPDRAATVLVVEDEVLIRMLAADSLLDSGYTVLEAGDAAEALEILASHDEVDVLFTDVNMPGPMDGIDLARLLHDRRPDVGLVITSGRGTPDPARLPMSSLYLAKPYLPRQLAAAVQKQTLH
jgi:two-component system, response regulator PdtaR